MAKRRKVQVDDDREARINLQIARDIAKNRGDTIKGGRVIPGGKKNNGSTKSGK